MYHNFSEIEEQFLDTEQSSFLPDISLDIDLLEFINHIRERNVSMDEFKNFVNNTPSKSKNFKGQLILRKIK